MLLNPKWDGETVDDQRSNGQMTRRYMRSANEMVVATITSKGRVVERVFVKE